MVGESATRPVQAEALAAQCLRAVFVLATSGVLGNGQKCPDVFPAGKEDSLNSPGEEDIHLEIPDAPHLSQACEESSLFGQRLCIFPYPASPHVKGDNQSWGRQLGLQRRIES